MFLAQMIVLSVVGGLWFARHDRGLLRERLAPLIQKEQPTADKILVWMFLMVVFAALVLMGHDAVRFGWSSMPPRGWAIGELALPVDVVPLSNHAGEYFRCTRGQSSGRSRGDGHCFGPYRIVRHPMYAATIGFLFNTSLLLGSWAPGLLGSWAPGLLVGRCGSVPPPGFA
jgi:protein-S-isoprenylcysteine O-methyltransferase Ste14